MAFFPHPVHPYSLVKVSSSPFRHAWIKLDNAVQICVTGMSRRVALYQPHPDCPFSRSSSFLRPIHWLHALTKRERTQRMHFPNPFRKVSFLCVCFGFVQHDAPRVLLTDEEQVSCNMRPGADAACGVESALFSTTATHNNA